MWSIQTNESTGGTHRWSVATATFMAPDDNQDEPRLEGEHCRKLPRGRAHRGTTTCYSCRQMQSMSRPSPGSRRTRPAKASEFRKRYSWREARFSGRAMRASRTLDRGSQILPRIGCRARTTMARPLYGPWPTCATRYLWANRSKSPGYPGSAQVRDLAFHGGQMMYETRIGTRPQVE